MCFIMVTSICENIRCVVVNTKHTIGHVFEGLLPLPVMALSMAAQLKFSKEAWSSPTLLVFTIGPFFTLCCTRVIIASVSKTRLQLFENLHLSIPILLSIVVFPINKQLLHLNERSIYTFLIAYAMFNSMWYTVHAINQITSYLDIYCLSIKHKKKDA